MKIVFPTLGLAIALATTMPARGQEASVQADAAASVDAEKQGYESLTRGPVHEAFAEPVELNAKAAVTVAKEPPEAIEELPPNEKPAGNAAWIPGYWSWDDERDDFIWISGVWRVAPSGQRWVAGYWTKADEGYRWVNGFWTATAAAEISYQPEPPESQEAGPTSDPPSDQHFWVPGCWIYRDYRYAWRPGYWAQSYADWVWMPQRYVWTPRGYLFNGGYWDYPLARRGMLFAPVYFHRPLYRDRGFYYTPGIAINIGGLHLHLFSRPRYGHYYFGNYYGDRYDRMGFYPWYAYRSWGGYDPFYQYHWTREGRHRRDWEDRIRDRHRYYRDNEEARPAATFAQLQRQVNRWDERTRRENQIAMTLRDAARDERFAPARLERVADEQRREIAQDVRQRQREIRDRRSEIERGERVAARPGPDGQVPRMAAPTLRLPDAPRVARRPDATPGDRQPDRGNRPDRADRPDRVERPDPTPRPDRPDAAERPDRPTRSERIERPEARLEREPRPEREANRPERPEVTRPEARPNRPEAPDRPRVERPRVERPSVEQPRVERPQPRVERPQPRVERPAPRTERPAPRVERPAPRVERPQPQRPRVERPQTRVERPQPQPRVERPQPQPRIAQRPQSPAPRAERAPAQRGGGNQGGGDRGNRGGRGRGRD